MRVHGPDLCVSISLWRAAALLIVALVAVGAPVAGAAGGGPMALKCQGRWRMGCRPASGLTLEQPLGLPQVEVEPEGEESLADALDEAYRSAPMLQAQRYALRANDEDYAQALAETRTTGSVQISSGYSKTVPGQITQSQRFLATSPIITSNTLAATASLTQPLYTGGRASADREAALAQVETGRAQLRGAEGDLLLQVVSAYADIRRDDAIIRLRAANLGQLQATLDEVKARREAGELTRTDIGLAETQFELAQSQLNFARQQLDQDRATYAALVGHPPRALSPLPSLPHMPDSLDMALALAEEQSPDLAQAIAAESRSRAQISAAMAQGRPTVNLQGTATLTGQALPYDLRNQDQVFGAQITLNIPLINGGRVGSLVAQAQDRNAVDSFGIESARRQVVAGISSAWSGLVTATRNIAVNTRQIASARIYDEGTFEEYRAGLRSTFDVLYAHAALRDAEIALLASSHDAYIAQATLLRRAGALELRHLLRQPSVYDPVIHLRQAAARGARPWDGAVRGLDSVVGPKPYIAPDLAIFSTPERSIVQP
jgi:outer membrane protein